MTRWTIDANYEISCFQASKTIRLVSPCPPPVAGFTWSAFELSSSFANTTTDGNSYLWDFGDGFTGSGFNQGHHYAQTGDYPVCLTATNSCGSDLFCDTISVCKAPMAAFTWDTTGLLLDVFNTSDQQIDAVWDWGDGTTSADTTAHVYAATGDYLVCLTVTNPCGVDSICDTVSVVAPAPPVGLSDLRSGSAISVHPNPTRGAFTVQLPGTAAYQLRLMDVGGRVVLNERVPEGNQHHRVLPEQLLQAGLYLLTLADAQGQHWHVRLVVQ